MTMWTSADAINAEVEYRRERVRQTSRAIRKRRSARAAAGERPANGASDTTEPADRPRPATVPAQRASGSTSATKQRA